MAYHKPSMTRPSKTHTMCPEVIKLLAETPAQFQGVHNFAGLVTRKETREEREAFKNGAGSNIFGFRGFPPQPDIAPKKLRARA